MHSKSRWDRGTRIALSWLLVWTMVASGWPTPALRELLGTTTAFAEEDQAAEDSQASTNDASSDDGLDTEMEGLADEAEGPVSADEDIVLTAQEAEDDDITPQVHLDNDNGVLYDDGDLVLTYDDSEIQDTSNPGSYSIGVEVGIIRPEDGYSYEGYHPECYFDPNYTLETGDNKAYTLNREERTITLHGAWLKEHLDQYFADNPDHDRTDPNERLRVSVWVYHIDEEGNPVQVHPYNPEHGYYTVLAANYDYRPQENRDLRLDEEFSVSREATAWIENNDHPWGEEVPYEVTKVEIVSQDPEVAGEQVFELTDGNQDGWTYRAVNPGTATFRVTHETIGGESSSYDFKCTAMGEEQEANAWIDDEGRNTVFSDSTLSLWVRQSMPIEDPYKLYVNVGPWDKHPGEEGFRWEDGFEEGDAYAFDQQTGEILLDGAWLFEHHYDHVQVFVAVAYEPEGQEDDWRVLEGGDGRWINVREATVDYDRERNRDLLPGWDGTVNDRYSVWVENAEHPDGEDLEYRVTGVEVVAGEELLADFHEDSDDAGNRWWYYRADDQHGTATLKVTYEIPEELGGGTDSYTFDLNISADVYDIRVWWDEEYGDSILPGTTVDLYAQGTHHREGQEDTYEGLTYTWELREGSEVGTLTVDPNDPQHATFTANTPSGDQTDIDDFVHVRAYLYDSGELVRDSGWAFFVRNAFCEIFPTEIENLGLGQSKNVDFEVRSYLWDEDASSSESYTTIDDDAQLTFWYDPNCLSITDSAGNEVVDNGQRDGDNEVSYPTGTFTITRTGDWGTGINMRAVWYDHDERRETWRNLWLPDLDQRMWFEGDHDLDLWVTREEDDSFTNPRNASNTLTLSEDLDGIDGLEVAWTVGTWDGDSYEQTFGPESGLYSVSSDGKTITANAAAMAEQGIRDLRVIATAKLDGREIVESDNDFWFHLQERERHYSFPRDARMLTGWRWGHWVEGRSEAFVNDEEHDHEHIDVVVTNVAIDNENVATVEREDDSWAIEAVGRGSAIATITYTDIDGTKGCTQDVLVSVGSDVYNMDVSVTSGDTWALPGETIPLIVRGRHEFEREDGSHGVTDEGLTYEWRIDGEGQDVATIEPSADGKSANVMLSALPNNAEHWSRNIWVQVLMFDEDENGQPQQVAEGGIDLMVTDGYYAITPYDPDFPSDTAVGGSFTMSPKLLLREPSGERDFTNDTKFEVRFDPQVVRIDGATIEEEDGNTIGRLVIDGSGSFDVVRLRNWGTNIDITASWTGVYGEPCTDYRLYHLDELWHDCEDFLLYKVDAKAATLEDEGNIEYWRCNKCEGFFLDSECHDEVAEELVVIPRLIDIADATVSGIADKTYSGSELTQTPVVKLDETTLVEGNDYKVSGTPKATNTGSYTVTITGMGLFGGTKSVSYKISPADISKATVSGIAGKTYTGKAQTQAPTVKVGTVTLKGGTDYALSYKSNVNAGTATVTITGKGNYAGTKSATFKISPASVSKATVSGIAGRTYSGKAQTQAPTVKMGTATLKSGTDYALSYENNVNAGTATVTITGKGNYTGSLSRTFAIARASLSGATVGAIAEQGYTGAAIKPTPSVKVGSVTLTKDTDYTLSYKANTKVGTATVTVTGKGNYAGTKSVTFKIVDWVGASRIPVSATARYTLLKGGYMRVRSGGKYAKSDAYVSISGATITGRKAGKTTVYLFDSKGKQVDKKTVEVFTAHGRTFEFESSVDRNYVLDIQGGSKKDGAQMIVYKRNNGKNQRYTLYLQSDGTYAIKSVNSGRYLTVEPKTNKYVQQWAWKGTKAQRWRLTVDSANRATFVNVATSKCFDVQGGKTTNSAKMIVWQSNNGLNQKWKLNQK